MASWFNAMAKSIGPKLVIALGLGVTSRAQALRFNCPELFAFVGNPIHDEPPLLSTFSVV